MSAVVLYVFAVYYLTIDFEQDLNVFKLERIDFWKSLWQYLRTKMSQKK